MSKKQYRFFYAAILALVVLASCTAVTAPVSAEAADTAPVATEPIAVVESAQTQVSEDATPEALRYMREEEKLAQDVYLALFDQWGLPVFDNIARAEAQHMEMVLQMLDAKGLADPAAANGPGEFTNADLQALYDQLVTEGSASIVAALTVGATIEDLDIADLQEHLQATDDEDVRWVFENLVRGSENHMRAFVRNLSRYGETYEPQFIDAAYFESIVADDMARGPGAASSQTGTQGRGGPGRGRWQR